MLEITSKRLPNSLSYRYLLQIDLEICQLPGYPVYQELTTKVTQVDVICAKDVKKSHKLICLS